MSLFTQQIFVLLSIATLGSFLGRLRLRGFSLGSAGVMLVGLLFGHFGLSIPSGIMDLGLLLFVYAVGNQAGPRFFRTFRSSGVRFLVLGILPTMVTLALIFFLASVMGISSPLILGIFSGALTNTSSLATAIAMTANSAPLDATDMSVSYGIVYPLSMFSVVLFMHLLPRVLRFDLADEEVKWQKQRDAEDPPVIVKQFLVTNENLTGKTLRELNIRKRHSVNISRVNRDNISHLATSDFTLQLGDIVTVIATAADQGHLEVIFGSEVSIPAEVGPNLAVVTLEVSETSLTGQKLADLTLYEKYGVLITRIHRNGNQFVAHGSFVLDVGDQIRVVGQRAAVDSFVSFAGSKSYLVNETNMGPFLLGLLLGITVGSVPIMIPGGYTVQLGLAGGVFLVSLLLGHFGRIGRFSMYVPQAAKNLCRELGLILFLSGAGSSAGSGLTSILSHNGLTILIAGIIATWGAVLTSFLFSHFVFKMNFLGSLGSICGTMNNSAALSAIREQQPSDLPSLAYAGIYPVSLIFKIIVSQIVVAWLELGQ